MARSSPMTTMYRLRDGEVLIVTGHFNKYEIYELKKEGYKNKNPSLNRNGIKVSDRRKL